MNKQFIFIVGSTSALARPIANHYAKRGWSIVLAARDVETQNELLMDLKVRFRIDVLGLKFDAVKDDPAGLLDQMLAFGFPARTFILLGTPEPGKISLPRVSEIAQVNFVVPATLSSLLVRRLEGDRSISITLIGSIAAIRGRAKSLFYGPAKGALTQFSEALQQSLGRRGKQSITLISLGFMESKMNRGQSPKILTVSPDFAAHKIIAATEASRAHVYVPGWWRLVSFLLSSLPRALWIRLPIKR